MQDQLRQFEVDANALEAIAKAQTLQKEAIAIARTLVQEHSKHHVTPEDAEAVLNKVAERTVVIEDPHGEGLIAFLEKCTFGEDTDAPIDTDAAIRVRKHCKESLPPDMDPLRLIFLDQIPILENDKVNASQLKQWAIKLDINCQEAVMDSHGVMHDLEVPIDAAVQRARLAAAEKEFQLIQDRARLVVETLALLRTWKTHSQVAHALCGALCAMAESCGEDFLEEMERRGLGVLASTVADFHKERPEVARSAFRLLSIVSIELLVGNMEENSYVENTVALGLEALNRRVRADRDALDQLARVGGRELLDDLEPCWQSNKMIALQMLNLRRRLRRSNTKSVKRKVEVPMPPDDVVRLRGIFDSLDPLKKGHIDKAGLGQAMAMLGIKCDEAELDESAREVDLDGSGLIEWPEFLFLMAKFGTNFSIEARFSKERLKEMWAVFEQFDTDKSLTLDLSELKSVMLNIGLCPEDWELRAMIAEVDADESGCIDWNEFLYLMSKKNVDAENQQRLAFEFFLEPQDRSGKIRKERFVQQMRKLTKEFSVTELEAMIMQAKFEDTDATYLTYKEFVKMMMSR
mmetsp:Transcript_87741/g.165471  ORF Transcript_87741/g.165471 Transcript_87741/m.165471 type:complete len:576 (+) Transcript_87741:222-1949(+)